MCMTNNLPAALVRCSSYEPAAVDSAIDRALSLLGGLDKYIKPGMRVFLKANLMRKSAPELCAVTHPAVVYAVAKHIAALGASVTVGDSPGGIFNQNILKGVYHTCGYTSLEEIDGVTLNYDCREVTVEAKDALKLKSFPMLAAIAEADVVVNVAKLKSHTLTVYSGAVKNLYGVIPGLKKAEYHFTFQDIDDFSDMLLDIAEHVSPVLHIIDGVFAMEGEGPGSGDARKLNAIIASPDGFAADFTALKITGYSPEEIPLFRAAMRRGRNVCANILGDDVDTMSVSDFVRANSSDTSLLKKYVPGFISKPLEKFLSLKPSVVPSSCVGCRACERVCPANAVEIKSGKATISTKKCIRCFCCMEFCPYKAIAARRNPLLRVVMRLGGEGKSN